MHDTDLRWALPAAHSHFPTPLNDCFIPPQASSTSFLLFVFSWWPCFLCSKMKAIRRKTLHVSSHLRPYSAFPIVLWLLPLLLPFLLSRTLHCFSLHPIRLPASALKHQCFPFLLSAHRYAEILPILENDSKNLSPTPHFQLPLSKSYWESPVLPISLDPLQSVFFCSIIALVEITSDLLGDKFPVLFSILISLEVAAAAFDRVDNLSSLKTFFPLLLRHYCLFSVSFAGSFSLLQLLKHKAVSQSFMLSSSLVFPIYM